MVGARGYRGHPPLPPRPLIAWREPLPDAAGRPGAVPMASGAGAPGPRAMCA
jgi:hypothetical protein